MDAESIGKAVHGIRYERCKSAWSRGETDVDAEVIARDLVDAAKEIMQEVVSVLMCGWKVVLIVRCRSKRLRETVLLSLRRRNRHLVSLPATHGASP